MRKKINRRFMGIAISAIIVITFIMTAVFYVQLKKQIFSDLEIVANLLIDEENYESPVRNLRITLIDTDGTVLFDSVADAVTMENHLNRPEVKEAMQHGCGKGIRRSDTLSESVFYYATRLENGQVLRVGKETNNVFSVLVPVFTIIIGVVILLSAICLVISHYLTTDILRPIGEMAGDMDHISEIDIYPELVPFAQKIRSQHEEILSSANIRQEFAANVTHELKTPLAAISGYAELMEAGLVNEKDIKHFSGEIRKSAARLLTLINDIIKLSQLDSGNEKEVLEVVNLAEIAEESVEMLSLGASKNQVEVTYEGVKNADIKIGKELAQELVYNLIENAIRYNKQGGKVFVRVRKEDCGVTFEVEDTGIGIPLEHQSRIFERFYRVDKSRSKALGGTGLGLAIVKHICTLTDGKLTLDSEIDRGTKIMITWENEAG
ncbi:MAG: ATP-binding protein [Eubacteriales bacterium]|nr:ATP-binding protein [Eubacteriales bacterium]